MNNPPYFDTFAAVLDYVVTAAKAQAVLTKPAEVWSLAQEPLNYGQTRRASFALDSFKGKPTRKHLHAVVYRMDSGRYELTIYGL